MGSGESCWQFHLSFSYQIVLVVSKMLQEVHSIIAMPMAVVLKCGRELSVVDGSAGQSNAARVGEVVGTAVGDLVGVPVVIGAVVGLLLGDVEGVLVGKLLGASVVGDIVGEGVGMRVISQLFETSKPSGTV